MSDAVGLGLRRLARQDPEKAASLLDTYASLDDLPEGSVVGTSSLRRQAIC